MILISEAGRLRIPPQGEEAEWTPEGTRTASADTDVLVVASRRGLAHLLELSRFHGPD